MRWGTPTIKNHMWHDTAWYADTQQIHRGLSGIDCEKAFRCFQLWANRHTYSIEENSICHVFVKFGGSAHHSHVFCLMSQSWWWSAPCFCLLYWVNFHITITKCLERLMLWRLLRSQGWRLCVWWGVPQRRHSHLPPCPITWGLCEKMSGNFLSDKSYISGYVPQ